jgi:hypothetical protein
MAYYNPFPPMFNNTTTPLSMSPTPQQPKINPQQFTSVAATLDDNSLNQLVTMARNKGISDQDIQVGLNFIKQLRR